MFLYTTTTIINAANAVDVQGNALLDNAGSPVARYAGTATEFKVIGTGTFKASDIKSVYKRAYTAGVKEVATITVPAGTAGEIFRLTVDVKLAQGVQSDYVNFTYDFKQPVVIDIASQADATKNATEIAKVLNKFKSEYGRSLFVASASGAVVTLTARTNDQRFKSIVLEKVGPVPLNTLSPEITNLATGAVTTPGKIGFGDDAWMLKSVMLPTYENTRHFGIIKDERPILGGNYSQYTLKLVTKAGEEGVFMGDDKSVTTHVFWVKADQVADFEAALEDTLVEQISGKVALTAEDDETTLANEGTLQLSVTGAIGNVTYASSNEALATVSATGLVTAAASGSGNVVLSATDSFGNVASITIGIPA